MVLWFFCCDDVFLPCFNNLDGTVMITGVDWSYFVGQHVDLMVEIEFQDDLKFRIHFELRLLEQLLAKTFSNDGNFRSRTEGSTCDEITKRDK